LFTNTENVTEIKQNLI